MGTNNDSGHKEVRPGITSGTLVQGSAEGGKIEWYLGNGSYEFKIILEDPRVKTLERYAETLGKSIPKEGKIPEAYLQQLPDSVREFLPYLSPPEQREAVIATLLHEAVTNGGTIGGQPFEGFGRYNPVVAASLQRERQLHRQIREIKDAPGARLKAIEHRIEEQKKNIANAWPAGWPRDITEPAVTAMTPSSTHLQEGSETWQTMLQQRKNAVVDFLRPRVGNEIDRWDEDTLYRMASQVLKPFFQEQEELRENLRRGLAELEMLRRQVNPELSAEDRKKIADLEAKIREEHHIQSAAVPEDRASRMGMLRASKLSNFTEKDLLICRHRNPLALYLLEKAGIQAQGGVGYLTLPGEARSEDHYFTISQETGNLIEFSGDVAGSYGKALRILKSDDAVKGFTNVYQFPGGGVAAYGTGYNPALRDLLKARGQGGTSTAPRTEHEEIATYDNKLMQALKTMPGVKLQPWQVTVDTAAFSFGHQKKNAAMERFTAAFGDRLKRNKVGSASTPRRRGQAVPSWARLRLAQGVGPDGAAMDAYPVSSASPLCREASGLPRPACGGAWATPPRRAPGTAHVGRPAWDCLSRGASRKRQLSRSRRARPNIWRFSIFKRLMCPSTGPLLQGKVTPALTAS
jgi:hypothetical protein